MGPAPGVLFAVSRWRQTRKSANICALRPVMAEERQLILDGRAASNLAG